MSGETAVVKSVESAEVENGSSERNEEVNQSNINVDGSSTSAGFDTQIDGDQGKGGVPLSSVAGIRVKRERELVTVQKTNTGRTIAPEPGRPSEKASMVEFPTVWPCPTCGYAFMTPLELQAHQPSCRFPPMRSHVCSICEESFERESDLNNHVVAHQVNRPHACRICGSLFRKKADLQNHMVTHQVEKPHKCTSCGLQFQRHSSLTNHMKIHSYAAGRALQTGPIPSFETLPVPGYSYYNNLASASSFSSFLANKVQSTVQSSVPATEITCLPDIDETRAIPADFQMPQHVNSSFTVEEPNQFELEANESQSSALDSSYLSVKNNGLMYGIKVEDHYNHQDLNSQQDSLGSPGQQTSPAGSDSNSLLQQLQDSPDEAVASMSSTSVKGLPKEISNESSSGKPHMCQFCGIHFAREKAYLSHMRLHNDNWEAEPSFTCQFCSQEFTDYVLLSMHLQRCVRATRKEDMPFPLRGSSKEDLSLPLRGGSQMLQNETLAMRLNPINKQAFKHACGSCDKKFATKQKLFRHMWIHRKKMFTCESCGDVFDERELLDRHRLEFHPPNDLTPYACSVCGKSFTSRQTLWEHGRVHGGTGSGAALLQCQECNKTFASRQGYQIHIRTHTGERPYGCRYCMKSFRDGGTLRKHERIHTGERPHACPLCMRAFNQKVVLREHVRWVHAATTPGEPPLPCMLCGVALPDREALCAHIVKHSDDMAHQARTAEKAANSQAKSRRGPRRSSKVFVQTGDGKFVTVDKEDTCSIRPLVSPSTSEVIAAAFAIAESKMAAQNASTSSAPVIPSATTTRTTTTKSGDSVDDNSRSAPTSPYNYPKNAPSTSGLNCGSFANNAGTSDATLAAAPSLSMEIIEEDSLTDDDLDPPEQKLDEKIRIPGFREIAPPTQSLRLNEPVPNVTVADVPDSEYHFINPEISIQQSDMQDPATY